MSPVHPFDQYQHLREAADVAVYAESRKPVEVIDWELRGAVVVGIDESDGALVWVCVSRPPTVTGPAEDPDDWDMPDHSHDAAFILGDVSDRDRDLVKLGAVCDVEHGLRVTPSGQKERFERVMFRRQV